MLRIDALLRNVLRQAVEQMADVVQQRRRDERGRGALPLRRPGRLQRMDALGHALAIGRVASAAIQIQNLVDDAHRSLRRLFGQHRKIHHGDTEIS
jgi:hypothetical protein